MSVVYGEQSVRCSPEFIRQDFESLPEKEGCDMYKINCRIPFAGIFLVFLLLCFWMRLEGNAQEQAQVVYDFMETMEDTSLYEAPDDGSRTEDTIPKGEKILIISQTAEGWYEILYRGEVLYISSANDTVENVEIEEDVIEEIEQNKSDLNLTAEEVEILEETDAEAANPSQNTDRLSKAILGMVAATVILSGAGCFYMNRREHVERENNEKTLF